jgi:tetratricopeptide (TPR) repeat protein
VHLKYFDVTAFNLNDFCGINDLVSCRKKSISLHGHFAQGDVEGAKVVYREATEVEADCIEAIYNLALSHKRQGELGEALATFKKISSLQPNNIEVSFQVILFFRDS